MKKVILLILLTMPTLFAADIAGDTSALTLGDLMTQTYEEVAGYITANSRYIQYDSTWVTNSINNACHDIARKYLAVPRDTTITISDSTELYELPSDFYALDRMSSIKAGVGLENGMTETNAKVVGQKRQSGNVAPLFYIISGHKVQLIPCNNDSDSVHVYYFARANTLDSTGDTSNISNDYKELIVLNAAQRLMRGKLSLLSEMDKSKLDDISARLKQEDDRIKERDKPTLEALPK